MLKSTDFRPARRAAVAAAALAVLAAPAAAADWKAQARFAADVEQAKGHLTVSREVHALGQHVRAGVHAAHPMQELGFRVIGPIKTADPALADRVMAALKKVGDDAHASAPAPRYAATVAAAVAALDEGVRRAVPEAVRATPAFQARVMRELIDVVKEEYEESVAQGRVVVEIEYQDAWGFFQRIRALYDAQRARLWPGPEGAARVDRHVQAVARALAAVQPPKAPAPYETVKRDLDAIARALDDIAAAAPR